jgi:hypothetical protein
MKEETCNAKLIFDKMIQTESENYIIYERNAVTHTQEEILSDLLKSNIVEKKNDMMNINLNSLLKYIESLKHTNLEDIKKLNDSYKSEITILKYEIQMLKHSLDLKDKVYTNNQDYERKYLESEAALKLTQQNVSKVEKENILLKHEIGILIKTKNNILKKLKEDLIDCQKITLNINSIYN